MSNNGVHAAFSGFNESSIEDDSKNFKPSFNFF
jgi:hypothetical protein